MAAESLGRSGHSDRKTRLMISSWPRLLDVHLSAEYLSVGASTIRDYCAAGILRPVELPGSTLRDRHGAVIAEAGRRRIVKILLDRADLDAFIDSRKAIS